MTQLPSAEAPTGARYWRAIGKRTSGDALAVDPVSVVPFGSFCESTTFEALSAAEIRFAVGAGAGMGGYVPMALQSSLPLDEMDVFWTLLVAGLVPFYTPTTVDPLVDVPKEAPAPSAYRAFKQLADWLDADDDEVAGAVGIGRTTPYAWRRDGNEPRAGTVRRLYELHAVVDALRRELGTADLRAWLSVGSPSRRERVLADGAGAIAAEVDAVLFDTARRPNLAWQPEPGPERDDAAVGTFEARPSGRRRRTASV